MKKINENYIREVSKASRDELELFVGSFENWMEE